MTRAEKKDERTPLDILAEVENNVKGLKKDVRKRAKGYMR